MPTSVIPYIPETIVVHLGAPTASAANVTVPFTDYVKNVVSSEIYPTWEPAALEANTLAIISFALNRYYTEYYRSRGYNFDITSSTAIDQKYIEGRNIYENISVLVDEIFDRYLRREGFVEPLAAKFCNGRVSASGAHSILPRAARTLFRFCARTTAILSWSQTRPSRSRHRPTPAHPCAGAIQMPT